jgi:PAS domain S-box-containing protein
MERNQFKSLLRRAVVFPLVGMAALTGVLWVEAFDLHNYVRLVDHTDHVLDQSDHLLLLLVDMETGIRGYVITGSDVFLEPYREGRQSFETEYPLIYQSVSDEPRQQQRLREIRAAYEGWLGYSEHIVALRGSKQGYDVLDESLQGKRKMDAIRQQVLEFQHGEEQVRAARIQIVQFRWTSITISCVVLGLGLGLFFAFLSRRYIHKLGSSLLRSEQRWGATLGSIGDAVIATDGKGQITFLNPVATAITGWETDQALHHPVDDVFKIVNEATRTAADDIVPEVLEKGHIVRVADNALLIAKDGREIPIEHSAAPILDSEGKIGGVVLVFRDVAEKRQVQEALAETAALLDLAHDAIVVVDLDLTIYFWNRGAEEMYGYSKQQAIGRISQELLGTVFPKPLSEIRADLLRDGRWEGELRCINRDGKRLVVASRWALQRDKNQQLSRVLAISSNITGRKLAEAALRESENAFTTLANLVPQLVWMCTPEGLSFYVNQRWVEYTGLTHEESRGTGWNIPFHPEDRQAVWSAWNDALQTGDQFRVESRLRAADGSYRWFLICGESLRNAEGSIVPWFGTCTDIEDLKQAEQQLRALTGRLERVREEERTSVARDLHDQIGQILTAIKMDMTWLTRRLPKGHDEVRTRLSGTIEMINDGVRSVRKICSGLRPGVLDDLGLAAAIEWQANEFASRTGIRCQFTVPAADLKLDGDQASAIFRIFQESLTNVTRHAEAQSVQVSLFEEDENLLLVVEDDGHGFREADVSGSLGLLGMKERAQGCGGDVHITSCPGSGTTVTVRVPLRGVCAKIGDHAVSNSR